MCVWGLGLFFAKNQPRPHTHIMIQSIKHKYILLQKQTVATQGTIIGRVIEQGTSAPLAGVLVEARKEGSTAVVATTTTNASGQYLLSVDRGFVYNLRFVKANYIEQTTPTPYFDDTSLTIPYVVMPLIGDKDFTIIGDVVASGTNIPLSGVFIELRQRGSSTVLATSTTDASGWYAFYCEAVINNYYVLTFSKNGYVTRTMDFIFPYSGSTFIPTVVMAS